MDRIKQKDAIVHLRRKDTKPMMWNLQTKIPVPFSKYSSIEAVLFRLSTDRDDFLIIDNKASMSDIAFIQVAHITNDLWCIEVNLKKGFIFSYRKNNHRVFESRPWTQYGHLTDDVSEINEIMRSILCEGKNPDWTRWKNITKKICLNIPTYPE